MLFSSITFLFMFLPIVMAVYYLVPNGAKNIVLLLASLFFYAWGEPVYVVLMILSIVLNYFCGRDIEANADNPKKAKLSLVFALTANILILGFFKYYGFLLDTVNFFLTTDIPYRVLPLPRGIYTYSLNHVPREICHLLQNSVALFDTYGWSKFFLNSNPNIFPRPIAISEYPLKSKYIWNA